MWVPRHRSDADDPVSPPPDMPVSTEHPELRYQLAEDLVADPTAPDRIRPEFNAGDGLHVNDAGAKAIADAVDLSLLNL